MFFPKKTSASTRDCSAETDRLKNEIETADAIVIGAGAGLSTAAGFTYSGERFENYFSDFIEKYNFRDMYSGGFYPFETLEEHWAYWSRYVYINRYMITDCFNVQSLAVRRPMTMRILSAKCTLSRKICLFQQN